MMGRLVNGSPGLNIGTFVWSFIICGRMRWIRQWLIGRCTMYVQVDGSLATTLRVNPSCSTETGIRLICGSSRGTNSTVTVEDFRYQDQCRAWNVLTRTIRGIKDVYVPELSYVLCLDQKMSEESGTSEGALIWSVVSGALLLQTDRLHRAKLFYIRVTCPIGVLPGDYIYLLSLVSVLGSL